MTQKIDSIAMFITTTDTRPDLRHGPSLLFLLWLSGHWSVILFRLFLLGHNYRQVMPGSKGISKRYLFDTLNVRFVASVDLDLVALVNEERHHDSSTCLDSCRLKRVG